MQPKFIKIFLCLIFLVPDFSFSQEFVLLKGTIGKYPVVIAVNYDTTLEEPSTADYFYESKKQTISLEGTFRNNKLILKGPVTRWQHDSTETLELHPGNGNWTGQWKSKDKDLPVNLVPLDLDKISHPFSELRRVQTMKTENPYNYVLTSELQLKIKDTICFNNKICFQVLNEEVSQIDFYRIISGAGKNQMMEINRTLDSSLFDDLNMALMPASEGSFDSKSKVIYVFKDFFVLETFAEWEGGAHPDFGYSHATIDFKTGNIIPPSRLIWFGDEGPFVPYSSSWESYKENTLIPSIQDLIAQIVPDSARANYDCDYFSDPSNWSLDSWYPTPEGICLGAFFPRSDRACDNPCFIVLPYKLIRKNLNPEYEWPVK